LMLLLFWHFSTRIYMKTVKRRTTWIIQITRFHDRCSNGRKKQVKVL
jgi:hypothetical protein